MNDKSISEKKQYLRLTDRKTPQSNVLKNCVKAFFIGGIICVIGQGVLEFYKSINLSEEAAASATSVTMIFFGVLLTGLNLYQKIAKHAGAGSLVPITGFANAVSAPAIEAKTEGYVLGVGAKIFTIAGPVILYGITASFIAGIVFFIFD